MAWALDPATHLTSGVMPAAAQAAGVAQPHLPARRTGSGGTATGSGAGSAGVKAEPVHRAGAKSGGTPPGNATPTGATTGTGTGNAGRSQRPPLASAAAAANKPTARSAPLPPAVPAGASVTPAVAEAAVPSDGAAGERMNKGLLVGAAAPWWGLWCAELAACVFSLQASPGPGLTCPTLSPAKLLCARSVAV